MKKLAVLLAGAMLMMAVGSAWALPFNTGRPISLSDNSLQTVFDARIAPSINATNDQSSAAVFNSKDLGGSNSYAISLGITNLAGEFGVYSFSTGQEIKLINTQINSFQSTFTVFANGSIQAISSDLNVNTGSGFDAFGFYWKDSNGTIYTEDSKNANSEARSLSYLINNGTNVTVNNPTLTGGGISTFRADGNDDWLFTFDSVNDDNFSDSIFVVKDVTPVPEPGTMVLLGFGMLGLAIYGKRRMNKEA